MIHKQSHDQNKIDNVYCPKELSTTPHRVASDGSRICEMCGSVKRLQPKNFNNINPLPSFHINK